MAYGTVKVDNVTFTYNSADATTTFSGIYASITNNLTLSGTATAATFTGTTANFTNVNAQNISVTTSLSGLAITGGTAGFTTITGTTVTGTTANFVTISGTTVTGTTANFVTVSGTAVTGNTGQFTNLAGAAAGFTTVTGTTITGTTANFVSGVFTTRISGTTVTGTTASFTSGIFTSLSGTTHTITSGVFALGTAALPSISFVSDPNTGIYSPGADQVAVATNGTGRLFVNNTGIGVGVAPSRSIDVYRGDAGQAILRLSDVDSRNIELRSPDGTGNQGSIGTVTNHDFIGITGNTERLRITSTGALNFVGAGTAGSTQAVSFNGSAPVNSLVIDSSGRLGIGTSAPTSGKLHIYHLNSNDTPNVIYSEIVGVVYPGTDNMSTGKFVNGAIGANAYGIWAETTDTSYGVRYAGYLKCAGYVYGNSYGLYAENTMPNVAGGGTAYAGYFKVLSAGTGTVGAIYGLRVENTAAVGGISYGAFISTVAGPSTVIPLRIDHAGSEKLRVDSSGRLLVGTSTDTNNARLQEKLALVTIGSGNIGGMAITNYGGTGAGSRPLLDFQRSRGTTDGSFTAVASGDQLGSIIFRGADGSQFTDAAFINCEVDGTPGANDMPGRLVFSTTADGTASPTERMRIISNGHMLLNTTSDLAHLTVADSTYGASDIFIRTFGLSGTSFLVRGDGDCENTNNSYGAFSDIKLKENIVGASSQWNDIKALQVRNYNLKSNPSFAQIGLVAQEVETVSPGLVSELPDRDEDGNDLGTVTKSVKYSVLYMKAVKALQEAMERIETLESRITAAGIE